MRVFEIQEFGESGLKPGERDEPVPGPGEVLVRLRAASLNYRDLLMLAGSYNPRLRMPVIPLSDGAGEVVQCGPGVSRWVSGDRVAGCFIQGWLAGDPERNFLRRALGGPLDGMLTEYAVFAQDDLVGVPDHLSYAEGSTLPCAGLTAWSALATYGNIRAGDTVVVLGTGGVSIFALQLAKILGARVIVTSSSAEKLQRARELGADECINYSEKSSWEKEVYRLTDKRGADLVVEVGGAGTLERSIRAVRPGGTVSLIGVLGGGAPALNLFPILMQNIRIQGIVVGHREGFLAMNRAIAQHALRPVVDRSFAFDEAPAAYAYLRSQKHLGKVCITID